MVIEVEYFKVQGTISLSRNVNRPKGYQYYVSKSSKITYLEQKDSFKGLAVIVDEKFSFREHLNILTATVLFYCIKVW